MADDRDVLPSSSFFDDRISAGNVLEAYDDPFTISRYDNLAIDAAVTLAVQIASGNALTDQLLRVLLEGQGRNGILGGE